MTSAADLAVLAESRWRGLPLLWQEELRIFIAYAEHRSQALHLDDLELWFERVQRGECPVIGSKCSKPERGSRFCAFHRPGAPPGM